jgi:hypothetical protein
MSYVLQVKAPGPAGEQTLRIPLLTLRRNICHQVVAASLELRTSFEEAPPALIAAVGGNPLKRALHRLRVALTGPQPGAGEILLDGQKLRALPPGREN